MGQRAIQLKAGEILFEEGDQSQALYVLQKGMIRIFKRKGNGKVELDTIRPGSLIGELAFLDHQPRSASAEALTTCDLIEISQGVFDEQMSKTPDWLKSLVKTITARLRATNNRLRILESTTSEFNEDHQGNRVREYSYLTTNEVMRFCTALLLCASRYGKNTGIEGIQFTTEIFERYSSQILQINLSKVYSLLEIFKQVGLVKGEIMVTEVNAIEKMIGFLNEQNLVEPSKKRSLSDRGFQVLKLIQAQHPYAEALNDKEFSVNIANALKDANLPLNLLNELEEQKFIQKILLQSADDVRVQYVADKLQFEYLVFWILNEAEKINKTNKS